jgi:uncharacterized protein YbgA (DUF1722 family)/uncharacterized protein YbbK (DUF523 family)
MNDLGEVKIRLGVSSCLLGNPVRYDGGHKRDRYITDILGKYVDFIPVCPEYEAGFGIPREAMRLTGDPEKPRLVTQKTKIDHTQKMQTWIYKRIPELEKDDLDGFIFKSDSPSSGMKRVKVYNDNKNSIKSGSGLFAKAFMDYFPLLPVEEEGRLHDIGLRENFIVRIFAFRRWKEQIKRNFEPAAIMDFHARHKYLLMAHSPVVLKEMGRLVSKIKNINRKEFLRKYETLLMNALRYTATVKKNTNVLQHMAGYFKTRLNADEKKELQELIVLYTKEIIPLIVPVTLIRHYVRKYGEEYLVGQYYLEPHPIELKLRNHA